MNKAQTIIKYLALAFAIFLIVSIFSTIFNILNCLAIIIDNTSKKEDINITKYELPSSTSILDIDLAYTNLNIKNGENLYIETNDNIDYQIKNNKISIKDKKKKFLSKTEYITTLYIPEDLKFDYINLSTGAGKVTIDNLISNNINFKLGAGLVEIETLRISSSAKIESGAGKFTLNNGYLKNLDFEMGIGEANLTTDLSGYTKIESGIGTLNLNIINNKDNFKFDIATSIGKIKVNNEAITSNTIIGYGQNTVKINGGIGTMNINFFEEE